MLSNGRNNNENKVIVRQLDFNTTQNTVEQYFSQYGHVREIMMKFNEQGRSKGFCFVIFAERSCMEAALKEASHTIDNKRVLVQKATSMEGKNKTSKLFCGGLPHALTEEQLGEYFGQYGEIRNFEFVYEKETQQRKHFCFIIFQDADAVEKITEGKLPPGSVVHHIGKYRVECKKKFEDNHPVQRKIKNQRPDGPPGKWGGGGGGGEGAGGYPGYSYPGSYNQASYSSYGSEATAYPQSGYSAAAGYESAVYPGTEYSGYEDGYGAGQTQYPQNPVSGYSSFPAHGYNGGYEDQRLQKGGGPMKQRGGMGGGRGGAYRPY